MRSLAETAATHLPLAARVWLNHKAVAELDRQLAAAERALALQPVGSVQKRAARAIDHLLEKLHASPVSPDQAGASSGHSSRSAMVAHMAEDGHGTLVVILCRDYDRLCSFDPARGERMMLAIMDRLRAMVSSKRPVVQIDRAHIGIWLGPDVHPEAALAEAEALHYALGNRISDGTSDILPDIAMRTARFDGAHSTPQATLSRALSMFASHPTAESSDAEIALAETARNDFMLEQDLRQAIARDELHMAFQPLIDALEGRVCGAEALLRWYHPQRGEVPPATFIPLMETAGLTQEIGLWALNNAIREASTWQTADLRGLRMAVNISGHQLEPKTLPILIDRTLARHELPASMLEVELTESVALADSETAARQVEILRKRGIHVAIDDFGTGFSSLSSLRTLVFDKLKIDRAFVTDVDRRTESQAICTAILALGKGLGIRILAEGVETAGEFAWLRAQGCRYFQGYYFARPLAAGDFIAFARDHATLSGLLFEPQPERLSA